MSWMVPETKLEPEQREFLRRVGVDKRNFWVRGFAGSGKSVLLVHALLKELASNPGGRACVVVFTHSLIDMFKTGIPEELLCDPQTKTCHVPVMTYHEFRSDGRHFDLVLVDEVQDLPGDVLRLLRQRCSRLIVAGDEAQSIYDDGVPPDAIRELTAGEPYGLSIVHRLTQKIIDIAQSILPEKNLHTAKRARLKNVDVVLAEAERRDIEFEWVWQQATLAAAPGAPVAVLFPRHELIVEFADAVLVRAGAEPWEVQLNRYNKADYDDLNATLEAAGVPARYLGNRYGSLAEGDSEARVFLMTYHSAKGLDFETVFMPRLSSDTEIWRDDDARAKTLLFVALTRSRLNLFLSYTDVIHPLLSNLPKALVRRVTVSRDSLLAKSTAADEDLPF